MKALIVAVLIVSVTAVFASSGSVKGETSHPVKKFDRTYE